MNNEDTTMMTAGNEAGISVKIRSIDNEFLVQMSLEDKIEKLKQKIESISQVPFGKQRLIFRGKLLKDSDTLLSQKISDLDVIHLVAKIGDNQMSEDQRTRENNQPPSRGFRPDSSLVSLMNQLFRGDTPSTEASSNSTSNVSQQPGGNFHQMSRRSNNQPREEIQNQVVPANRTNSIEYNLTESREVISQTLATIDNLIQCGDIERTSQIDEMNEKESEITSDVSQRPYVNLFDFSLKKLIKGQWIDVKDTVDQWLEAQVIEVEDDKVFVHYNGWGSRWDEWIEMKSNRIMPFRYHTRQSSISHYQSPFPNARPDVNVSLEANTSNRSVNFFDVFDDIHKVMKATNHLVDQIQSQRKKTYDNNVVSLQNSSNNIEGEIPVLNKKRQREVYYAAKKVIPLLDRLGRLITDVGTYISYDLRHNQVEDLDHELFKSNEDNIDPLLKPFTQEEQTALVEEMRASSNTRGRNRNMQIVPPVNRMDQMIKNQVTVLDTPLSVVARHSQTLPVIDIYVHTFLSPVSGGESNANTTTATINTSSAATSSNRENNRNQTESLSSSNNNMSIIENSDSYNQPRNTGLQDEDDIVITSSHEQDEQVITNEASPGENNTICSRTCEQGKNVLGGKADEEENTYGENKKK